MVERGKEYVLQWNGHAAHVTERFSGLLARQALVDVTLICQGQRIRVHKLVLASSSLYFEEMLEQDLGQEPVILLRDLDFEVLKAMIEFMYCGQTTISQCHLQTLLDAAQVFKVKELKCIIESMIKCRMSTEKVRGDLEESSSIVETPDAKKNNYKTCQSGEQPDDKSITVDLEEEEEVLETKRDGRILYNTSGINYNDAENSLYEITENSGEQMSCQNEEEESLDHVSFDNTDSDASRMSTSEDDDDNGNEKFREDRKIANFHEANSLKSFYNEERCCKFINGTELREIKLNDNSTKNCTKNQDTPRAVGECLRVYSHKKRQLSENDEFRSNTIEPSKKLTIMEESLSKSSVKSDERDKEIRKSLKVYSHKRRRASMDEKKCQLFDNIGDSIEGNTSTSSIDLNDGETSKETPVNLTSNLDMETSEYIWNLSSETIQHVVGCTINSEHSSIARSETKNHSHEDTPIDNNRDNIGSCNTKISRQMKEIFSCENGNSGISETPVLRRSVRINQLENDDSLNNNNGTTISINKGREKSVELDKDNYANNLTMNITKTRRRVNKEGNFRIIDENIVVRPSSLGKTNNLRSLRSRSTKLSTRKSDIPRRDERKKNSRENHDKIEKIDSSSILVNTRLNTIASVDRALWGDMSDLLENHDNSSEELLNYSTSREIPFAVGLLPLRAALERMQATLDHQPRKTRSSVAPWRQEAIMQKRKFINDGDNSVNMRKHFHVENHNMERAVCHIEIRTSSNRDEIQNRQISTDDKIVTVGTKVESNEQ